MAIAISMTISMARAQGATARGGRGYGALMAQGATGLRKTSGKSYGKLVMERWG